MENKAVSRKLVINYAPCSLHNSSARDPPNVPVHLARLRRSSLDEHIMRLDRRCKRSRLYRRGASSFLNIRNATSVCRASSDSRYFCCRIMNFADYEQLEVEKLVNTLPIC